VGRHIFYWKTEIGGWAGMRQGFERQGGIVDQLMLSAFQKMKRCWRLFFADGRTCFLGRWLRRLVEADDEDCSRSILIYYAC